MLPELRASEQLSAIEAASFPNMGKDGQRDTMRRLTHQVGRGEKPAKATEADLAHIGIQVEHVPKEEVTVDV